MLNLDATQLSILASSNKRVSWLITVSDGTTRRWSTKEYSYGGQSYDNRIIPESFQGITLTSSFAGSRLICPNLLEFQISDPDSIFTPSSFVDQALQVDLVVNNYINETIIATWKFNVTKCYRIAKVIYFSCEDFLARYLKGQYPNTKFLSGLSPKDTDQNDSMCVPIIFGTAYIPVRARVISNVAYYVMGPAGVTYTITELRTPADWGSTSTWTSGSFTFTQSNQTLDGDSYRCVQPIIADSNSDGVADATGIFYSGSKLSDPQLKFSRSDTSSITSYADVIEYVLESMGVSSSDIDTGVGSSFDTAKTTYASWGITCNGGFFYKQDRAAVLKQLLIQCHSVLQVTDKIELHVISKTSQKTITSDDIRKTEEVGGTTLQYKENLETINDSAYVSYCSGGPQMIMNQSIVEANGAHTNISSDNLVLPHINGTVSPQAIGELYFQRAFGNAGNISADLRDDFLSLQPDDVVTINDSMYGSSITAWVQQITIQKDLTVTASLIKSRWTLDDFGDLAPSTVTIVTDTHPDSWSPVFQGPDGSTVNQIFDQVRIGDSIWLDGVGEQIIVGATEGIIIDGANTQVRSSNFTSGALGSGFSITPEILEINNILARGMIRTAVFQKDVVSAVGGSMLVAPSDVLDANMTANDNSTMTIKGTETFSNNELLRIKDGSYDEWFEVSNAAAKPVYTVIRDKAGTYAANTNPAWTKGSTVVSYGNNGKGRVYITSSDTDGPYISVISHANSPWSSLTNHLRIGKVANFLDYGAGNNYGAAFGNNNAFMSYDPVQGLRVKGTITITGGNGFANLTDRPTSLNNINSTENNMLANGNNAYSLANSANNLANAANNFANSANSTAGSAYDQANDAQNLASNANNLANVQLPEDANMSAYWSMDDAAGNFVFDNSGHGRTLAITGTANWAYGKSGVAYYIPNGDHYAAINSTSAFDFTGQNVSVSAWIYQSNNSINRCIFSTGVGDTSNVQLVLYGCANGALALSMNNGVGIGNVVSSAGVIPLNTWTHVAFLFNNPSNLTRLFVNGNQSGTNNSTITDLGLDPTSLFIGKRAGFTTNNWIGAIDEFRIYQGALSESEIKALYLNPSGTHKAATGSIGDPASIQGLYASNRIIFYSNNGGSYKMLSEYSYNGVTLYYNNTQKANFNSDTLTFYNNVGTAIAEFGTNVVLAPYGNTNNNSKIEIGGGNIIVRGDNNSNIGISATGMLLYVDSALRANFGSNITLYGNTTGNNYLVVDTAGMRLYHNNGAGATLQANFGTTITLSANATNNGKVEISSANILIYGSNNSYVQANASGIWIRGNNNNMAVFNESGMRVYNNNTEVAYFGNNITLKDGAGANKVLIDTTGVSLYQSVNNYVSINSSGTGIFRNVASASVLVADFNTNLMLAPYGSASNNSKVLAGGGAVTIYANTGNFLSVNGTALYIQRGGANKFEANSSGVRISQDANYYATVLADGMNIYANGSLISQFGTDVNLFGGNLSIYSGGDTTGINNASIYMNASYVRIGKRNASTNPVMYIQPTGTAGIYLGYFNGTGDVYTSTLYANGAGYVANNKIVWDTGGNLSFYAGANKIISLDANNGSGRLNMTEGSDIVMFSIGGNPARFVFSGNAGTRNVTTYISNTGTNFYFYSESANLINYVFGSDGLGYGFFNAATFYAKNLSITGWGDTGNYARIACVGDSTNSWIAMNMNANGISRGFLFGFVYNNTVLWPYAHNYSYIGTYSSAHAAVYSKSYPTPADILYMDSLDDLGILNNIKGSGMNDPVTGFELIDDNTLPQSMLIKHPGDIYSDGIQKGDIAYDPDGKPYIDLVLLSSLLRGGIVQLHGKHENNMTNIYNNIGSIQSDMNSMSNRLIELEKKVGI
jgi:hypothetical protein